MMYNAIIDISYAIYNATVKTNYMWYNATANIIYTVYNAIVNIIYVARATASIQALLELFLPVLSTIFFPSHLLLSEIIKTMVSGERRINAVAITYPWKEVCQTGDQTSSSLF